MSNSYKNAGVDVEAGYEAVELMKVFIQDTYINGVIGGIGGFGGMFDLSKIDNFASYKEPVLVSGTDGVGTKVKLAFILDKHDTIGIDAVAMCVNDVVCCGAKPLFFLDYINCGKNIPAKIAEIVKGVADGCVKSGCALIGGETAEHPGLTPENEYDLAGFCVGIVDKSKIIDGASIKENDVVIGLASSGVHSNGFSLIRKIFQIKHARSPLNAFVPEAGRTLGEELLTPTQIYVKPILALIEKVQVKGIAHVTGGGFYENIPRCIPSGLTAEINKNSFEVPPIFRHIEKTGNISERDMLNTFNMGIGMVCVVSSENAEKAITILAENEIKAYQIGKIIKGEELIIK